MKLFSALLEKGEFLHYAETLDWLLSDNKFSRSAWDQQKVQQLTKSIYKIKGFSRERLTYGSKKTLTFPKSVHPTSRHSPNYPPLKRSVAPLTYRYTSPKHLLNIQ